MNLLDNIGIEARIDNLLTVLTLLDHSHQNGIHNLVFREVIAILLTRAQLRRRLLLQDILRNYIALSLVDVASHIEHLGLVEVARNAECTCGVTIEGTHSECILTLIRRIEHHIALFVLHRHQHNGTQTSLDILLGSIELVTTDSRLQGIYNRGICLRNRQYAILYTYTLCQLLRIDYGVVGRELRRHQQCKDILLAESLNCNAGHDCRVDTARQAHASLLVSVLAEVVTQAQHRSVVDVACTLVTLQLLRQLARLILCQSVIYGKVLLERLHKQSDIALIVDDARGTVVNNLTRAANLIYENNGLRLHECKVVHCFVAIRHQALAITASIDTENNIDITLHIFQEAEIVAHNDGNLLAGNANDLHALAAAQKAHLSASRNICLCDVALDLSVLDNHRSTLRAVLHKYRRTHNSGNTVAVGGNLVESLVTKFQECGFTEKVERRSATQCLLGKDYDICALELCTLNRNDDFGGIACDISNGVV